LEQARSLEDAWDAVNRARLQGDKAVTDEEKLQHAIALAQLDTHQKIRDLKRSFSDGKIAGGSSELKKLIAAWREVEDIQTKSAQRAYDESQARKQDEALKQITDDYKKLADITQELDILDDKGYNHQFVQVEQKFNSFRDTVSKVYEDLIQDATAASISQGLMFSPEVIKLMGDYAAMLKRIEDARKDAMAKVTASIVESDASKLRQALKEAQTKDGYTYTFDQQAMAVEALNRELRLTPDALKKVKSEIEAAQKRSGDWLGGLKAGFIDFYNSATNVYEKIRKASNKWLEDFSNKLAQMVVTGKANFKELAQSIIQDLIAIYIESLLVQVVWKSMKWIDSLSTLGSGTGSSAGASSSTGSYAASHPLSIGPAGSALGAMASPINAPSARGGDVSISVSVDARGNTDTAVSGAGVGTRSAAMLGQMIADSVRQVIVEEKRPRGLLESLA
jgi:phage-related minor tail protein